MSQSTTNSCTKPATSINGLEVTLINKGDASTLPVVKFGDKELRLVTGKIEDKLDGRCRFKNDRNKVHGGSECITTKKSHINTQYNCANEQCKSAPVHLISFLNFICVKKSSKFLESTLKDGSTGIVFVCSHKCYEKCEILLNY